MKNQPLLITSAIFILTIFIFYYLLLINRDPSQIPSALINKKVPLFETESLLKEKKFISSQHFNNKTTLVNFFATWCKPCRDEHVFIKFWSNNENIKIVGINYKDKPEKTIKWLKKLGNPYDDIALDKNGNIAIDWGVYGIPETFIIDSNGIIKYRHVGPVTKKVYEKMNIIIEEIN